MSLQVGIFDFFAYTIPGGAYFLAMCYLGKFFKCFSPGFKLGLDDISFTLLVFFAVVSYVLGLLFDPISDKVWFGMFNRKSIGAFVLEKLKDRYADLKISFEYSDWSILLAYIEKEDLDAANEINKFNAVHKMLRSLSFFFFLFSIVLFVQSFRVDNWYIAGVLLCVLFSYIALKESKKYLRWFFSVLFEAIIVRNIPLYAFVNRNVSGDETPEI